MNRNGILVCLVFGIALIGCTTHGLAALRPDVDVAILNRTSKPLEKAAVHFGKNYCAWGWVAVGGNAVYLLYPYPITENASLEWIHGDLKKSRQIDLKGIYPKGKNGRINFVVEDSTVTAVFIPVK